MIYNGWAAKKTLGKVGEEPEDDLPDIQDKKLPYIGNPELILNNERFTPGSELYAEAQKMATCRADRFLDELDKKLGSNVKPEDPIDRNTLQSVANALQPEFVDDLCKPGSFWMQKIYGGNEVPEYLPLYVRCLFKPIQVPEGSKLKLEVPAAAVGFLAALGAVIGAWLVNVFAWTSGMKQPGDITTLVGATVGAGLFSWLIFWATANETVRKTLEGAVGITAIVDAFVTASSFFVNLGYFFGIKKQIQGGFLYRLALYAACWFVIHLMKRPVVFDRQEYKNKLEALYFERIQSIVLFLASCNSVSEKDHKDLNEEQNRLANIVDDLKAELKRLEIIKNSIPSIVHQVRTLWDLDIRNLESQLCSIAQEFVNLRFELPVDKPMNFTEQLKTIPNLDKVLGVVKKSRPDPRRFKWSEEDIDQFRTFGLIFPGTEVVVLDEPEFQNGALIKKGNVQSAADYFEL